MSDRRFILKPFIGLEGDGGDPDGVLVDTHSATMCSCNEAAWMLLHALKPGASVSDLVARLVTTFDVAEADARDDVMNFIQRLAAMGMVDENA